MAAIDLDAKGCMKDYAFNKILIIHAMVNSVSATGGIDRIKGYVNLDFFIHIVRNMPGAYAGHTCNDYEAEKDQSEYSEVHSKYDGS